MNGSKDNERFKDKVANTLYKECGLFVQFNFY